MKAVYYFDPFYQYCPVKKYLSQYKSNPQDSVGQRTKKENLLVSIRSKIDFVVLNQGRQVGSISKGLKEYSFFEIRTRKDQDVLIRIFYIRDCDKIVFLNAIEKSDKDNRKKDKRDMGAGLEKTEKYQNTYNKYKNTQKCYEEYI